MVVRMATVKSCGLLLQECVCTSPSSVIYSLLHILCLGVGSIITGQVHRGVSMMGESDPACHMMPGFVSPK